MADTLPVDTTSLPVATLIPPQTGRYTPSLAELVRQAGAARVLAEHAAQLHIDPRDYEKRGLAIEWHHQLDDPAVPYLSRGGQS